MINASEKSAIGNVQWCADDAFLCIVSIVFSQLLINCIYLLIVASNPILYSATGFLITYICGCVAALLITILHSHVRTWEEFRDRFGLLRPSIYTSVGSVAAGIMIAGVIMGMMKAGYAAPHNTLVDHFYSFGQVGIRDSKFVLVLAPLVEETILRGYVYRALRRNYSISTSLACILAIAILTHFAAVSSGILAAGPLLGLHILVSLLREMSNSSWNCILCHLAYNCMWAMAI